VRFASRPPVDEIFDLHAFPQSQARKTEFVFNGNTPLPGRVVEKLRLFSSTPLARPS
jgi:hypothetical protein